MLKVTQKHKETIGIEIIRGKHSFVRSCTFSTDQKLVQIFKMKHEYEKAKRIKYAKSFYVKICSKKRKPETF